MVDDRMLDELIKVFEQDNCKNKIRYNTILARKVLLLRLLKLMWKFDIITYKDGDHIYCTCLDSDNFITRNLPPHIS